MFRKIAIVCALLGATSAQAAIVTMNIGGKFINVSQELSDILPEGSTYTGRFQYDTSAPIVYSAEECGTPSCYRQVYASGSAGPMNIMVNGFTYSPSGLYDTASTYREEERAFESYAFGYSLPNGPEAPGFTLSSLAIVIWQSIQGTGPALLPETGLGNLFLPENSVVFISYDGFPNDASATATIDFISVARAEVSEPGMVPMMGLGLAAIYAARRLRTRQQ